MHTTFAFAALAAVTYAQGVTETITPTDSAPAGCSASFSGDFEITAVNSTVIAKRDLTKRTCGAEGSLTISLKDGILLDAKARTGYIAANYQFQFDGPAQTGAIYTGGFSACSNGSLALGGSAVWYECLSGSFYNLYDQSWAPQCQPILIEILPCGAAVASATVGQISDGQATGTAVASPVSQIPDGQPKAASPIPITQISDGQPQIPTGLISQIATPAPVTQISDGQPQVPTAIPTTLAPVTTAAPAVISQISDGQIQAPNTTAPAVVASPTVAPSQIPLGLGNTVTVGSSLAAVVVCMGAMLLL